MDLNNLLTSLGKVSASMQKQRNLIDTNDELNTYVSGWDAIKAKAEEQNKDDVVDNDVDMKSLETQMKSELAKLMDVDFGKSKGLEKTTIVEDGKEVAAFTDEEALAGLMSALSETMDAEMTEKVDQYNKKHPDLAEDTEVSVKALKNIVTDNNKDIDNDNKTSFTGFDNQDVEDLMEVLGDSAPKVFRYMSNAIETGRADAIASSQIKDVEEFGPELGMANIMRGHSRVLKAAGNIQSTYAELQAAFNAKINGLLKMYELALTEEARAKIELDMMNEEIQFEEQRAKFEAMMQIADLSEANTELKPEEE